MTRGGADLKTWWGFMVFRGVCGGAVQRRATLFRKCCTAVLEWTPFSRRENGRGAAPAPAGAACGAFTCPTTSPRGAAGRGQDMEMNFLATQLPVPSRSEERRVGTECVSRCRYRWARGH